MAKSDMLCTKCLERGPAKRAGRPGLWVSFLLCGVGGFVLPVLWLGCVVIAIIEQVTVAYRCRKCESPELVEPTSTMGQLLLAKINADFDAAKRAASAGSTQ
jgi:hypothetical protein